MTKRAITHLCLVILILCTVRLYGQTITAGVNGTVTDVSEGRRPECQGDRHQHRH